VRGGSQAPASVTKTPPGITDKHLVETRADESAGRAGRYLTFRIARQDFAMEIRTVRGILPSHDMESVQEPWPALISYFGEWICGFATLRGRNLPVIDLRSKLHLPHASQGRNRCIVAIEVKTPDGPLLAGFLADRVTDVVQARECDFSRGKLRVSGRLRQLIEPGMLLPG
jgi:chemotaxis signal transduction protein